MSEYNNKMLDELHGEWRASSVERRDGQWCSWYWKVSTQLNEYRIVASTRHRVAGCHQALELLSHANTLVLMALTKGTSIL